MLGAMDAGRDAGHATDGEWYVAPPGCSFEVWLI